MSKITAFLCVGLAVAITALVACVLTLNGGRQ
jgi:hypothetical protein